MNERAVNNWVVAETPKFLKHEAEKTLKKVSKSREGKRFKMVKISNTPPTWKEIEIS
jgi:hypothetical protein